MFQILINLFKFFTPSFIKNIFSVAQALFNFFKNLKQKNMASDAMQSHEDESQDFILVRYNQTGVNKYQKDGREINATWAKGSVFFKGHEMEFESGRWGNGFAPRGEYIARYYRNETEPAFCLFGIGFFISIEPVFETDRSELGIHFDGGDGSDGQKGFAGTLGCIGIKAKTLEEATQIKNFFRDIFDGDREFRVKII